MVFTKLGLYGYAYDLCKPLTIICMAPRLGGRLITLTSSIYLYWFKSIEFGKWVILTFGLPHEGQHL